MPLTPRGHLGFLSIAKVEEFIRQGAVPLGTGSEFHSSELTFSILFVCSFLLSAILQVLPRLFLPLTLSRKETE